ncbi:Pentatricopeptide repeat-containing protein, chloroplastic [Sesamum angolense]|uniref:Pentatricopeptide repeat-containing protein, chloroplastic n=1 Tax=Sesamum angolense TaxID=2727404 RepID=A0AAE1X8D7_9LAMI|nr:Pentatricopeptide repeat-containing protein, chloroplastic [Sesamum angolense]
MATLIRPINFSSTSIPTSPLSLKKAHRTPLLKVPQKPTSLEEAVLSLTDKLAVTNAYKSLDEAYSSVLDHCTHRNSLSLGKQIHTHIIKRYSADDLVFLNTKLVFMYGKSGSLLDAEKLFDEMCERSIFTYNAMLGAYISNGEPRKAIELYADMRFFDILPDAYTCSCVLKACAGVEDICSGREIHGYLIKFGLVCNEIIVNSLVSMYARCNSINAAEFLFARSGRRDVVLWNLMISAYVTTGMRKEALRVFEEMQNAAVIPSTYTFVAALQACEELLSGMQIHALVLKSGLSSDRYVANALLVMYSKCSRIDDATRVFEDMGFFREITRAGQLLDQASIISALSACGRSGNLWNGLEIHAFALKNGMELDLQVSNTIIDMYAKCSKTSFMGSAFQRIPQKDHVSWTTIITGYVQNFCYVKALQSFREVLVQGIEIDKMMIESVLLATRGLKCISLAKEIHGYIVRRELSDIVLWNTFVDVYGESGEVDYARNIFELLEVKNVVTWTSMIACYVQNGLAYEALGLSFHMVKSGVELDSIALLSILSAAADLSALRKGKEVHGFLIRRCLQLGESIASSLVDMYASCGAVDNSYKVFNSTRDKDLVLWTSMINAYGMHGQGVTAIELFRKMEAENLRPDHIAFLALLYACSHSSLVDAGKRYFNIMQCQYDLEPWPEHYACLVDLLGRANCLEEAFELVKSMKLEPTAAVWCALLAGRWEDVEQVRMRMKVRGLKKDPGCSWIEVGNKVHTFMTRDRSHPQSDEIYDQLSQITEKLETEGGYKAQTSYVLHNVEEKEKVKMLYGHSERLALAYGLLTTSQRTPIRVTKNLRVCGDCHTFTKLVSKIFEREIIGKLSFGYHYCAFVRKSAVEKLFLTCYHALFVLNSLPECLIRKTVHGALGDGSLLSICQTTYWLADGIGNLRVKNIEITHLVENSVRKKMLAMVDHAVAKARDALRNPDPYLAVPSAIKDSSFMKYSLYLACISTSDFKWNLALRSFEFANKELKPTPWIDRSTFKISDESGRNMDAQS